MENIFIENQLLFILLLAWSLPWKGVALWRATKNNHKKWFIVLLVLNTFAITEIIYIFFFNKEKKDVNEKNFKKTNGNED